MSNYQTKIQRIIGELREVFISINENAANDTSAVEVHEDAVKATRVEVVIDILEKI